MRQFALAVIGLVFCLPASAQQWEIGVTGGYGSLRDRELAFLEDGRGLVVREISNGVRIGGRVSFNFHDYFAHEMSYVWQRAKALTVGKAAFSIHNLSYNFTAHATRRDTRVRPFVTGGVGASAFIRGLGETEFGYNYGGGIKFLVSEEFGIRFDVRDHVTTKPFIRITDGMFHILETSVTFSYMF